MFGRGAIAGSRRRGVVTPGQVTLFSQTFEGTGSGADSVTTFGMAFRQGDLAPDDPLIYRNGVTPLRTQVVPTLYHDDGSVRHAIISVECPAIANGAQVTYTAVRGATHPSPGSALNWATVTTGRTAVVTLEGQTYDLLANVVAGTWISGPLAIQRRAEVAINSAHVGGVTSARLVADITVTKDGDMFVDMSLRNDIGLRAGGAHLTGMDVALAIDGTTMRSVTNHTIYQYTWGCRWLFGRRSGAASPAKPVAFPVAAQFIDSRIMPPMDYQLGLSSTRLTQIAAAADDADWDVEDDPRDMDIASMNGNTGGASQLGMHHDSVIAALSSTDRRMIKYVTGMAETAQLFPCHIWDVTGGAYNGGSGTGGWIDKHRWPNLSITRAGDDGPSPAVPGVSTKLPTGQNRYEGKVLNRIPLESHAGEFSSFPYLITGRRCFLDQLVAQAHSYIAYTYSEGPPNFETGGGVNVHTGPSYLQQMRGWAYIMRHVGRAANLCPTSLARTYLRNVCTGNWNYVAANNALWSSQRGEMAGWIRCSFSGDTSGFQSGWMHGLLYAFAAEHLNYGITAAQGAIEYIGKWWELFLFDETKYKQGSNGVQVASGSVYTEANYFTTRAAYAAVNPGDSTWNSTDGIYGLQMLAMGPALLRGMNTGGVYGQQDRRTAEIWGFISTQQDRNGFNDGTTPYLDPLSVRAAGYISVVPYGTTRANVAPNIPTQTLTVRQDASSGGYVGTLQYTGGILGSLSITGGTGAASFTIVNAGGGVRLTGAPPAVGTYSLTLSCANRWGTAGTVGTINVEVTSAAPVAADNQSFSLPSNKTNGETVGQIAYTGATLTSCTINSGNTSGAVAVSSTGLITVANAAALAGLEGSTLTLSVTLTNSFGSVTRTVLVPVVVPTFVPVITPGQALSISFSAATVGQTVGTVATTVGSPPSGGSAATSFAITGGTGAAYFAISSAGVVTVTASLASLSTSYGLTLTVTATNAAGTSTATSVAVPNSDQATVFNTVDTAYTGMFSLRRLRPAYSGPAIRVAVTTNNGTQHDIGFDGSGNLDTADLLSKAAGGSAWVVTWYDQSGNGQNLSESTAARRLQIVNSGALYDAAGTSQNRAAINCAGSDRGFFNGSYNLGGTPRWGYLLIARGTGANNNARWLGIAANSTAQDFEALGGGSLEHAPSGDPFGLTFIRKADGGGNVGITVGSSLAANVPHVVGVVYGANTRGRGYADGTFSAETTATFGNSFETGYLRLFRYLDTGAASFVGEAFEFVTFTTTSDSDIAAIRANARTYYGF